MKGNARGAEAAYAETQSRLQNASHAEAQRRRDKSRRAVGFRRVRSLCASAFILCVSSSCEWFTDFKRQPSLWTWEPVKDSLTPSRGNPQMSVPVTGMAVAGFQVSYAPLPATIDSMASIPNPTSGQRCVACKRPQVLPDQLRSLSRRPGNGRWAGDEVWNAGNQHRHRHHQGADGRLHLRHDSQWPRSHADVQPYRRARSLGCRQLSARASGHDGQAVVTGPLAAPGVTGDKLPGATRTAPTRQAPFMRPRGRIVGGVARGRRHLRCNRQRVRQLQLERPQIQLQPRPIRFGGRQDSESRTRSRADARRNSRGHVAPDSEIALHDRNGARGHRSDRIRARRSDGCRSSLAGAARQLALLHDHLLCRRDVRRRAENHDGALVAIDHSASSKDTSRSCLSRSFCCSLIFIGKNHIFPWTHEALHVPEKSHLPQSRIPDSAQPHRVRNHRGTESCGTSTRPCGWMSDTLLKRARTGRRACASACGADSG